MGINVKKTKLMINSENAGKVTMEIKLSCVGCRKGLGTNFILCQFCRCWLHKKCSRIRGKLKEDRKFKHQTRANQLADIENCTGIELNVQSPEIVKNFCYIGDSIGARRDVFDSVKQGSWVDGVNSEILCLC